MKFYSWAKKWGIPQEAIEELKNLIFSDVPSATITTNSSLSERDVQAVVKLEASKKGCRLWRNNLGAVYTQEGVFIRYGLANESEGINKTIKSADLIGIRPVVIKPEHTGLVIGQFLSREIKTSNWKYKNTEREQAQLRWAELINALGGDACFANSEGSI
jgi:hypothetical protein